MTQDLGGKLVVLIGGAGFLGRHVAQELLTRGARLRVASRRAERAFAIKPLGNLGQVQLVRTDITRPASLVRAVAGADAVVNLAGAFAGDLDAVMGSGVGALARAATAAGAKTFVHISAIGADAAGETAYARAKAAGETAVLDAFQSATVLRPSILFGADDTFINRFAGLISLLPAMPVFAPQAKLQPLFVDDCAKGIVSALADPEAHGGKTFELAGPEVLTMLELNQRIAVAAGRSTHLLPLPDTLSGLIAAATGWLPGAPITNDQWKLLSAGNVASDDWPGITALGITPRPIGLFLDRWLVRFRKHGRFADRAAA
ncbi:complex I NDUFA9 subunit family protein [Novosphingobium sp.]|uniref:complex I NDUFA9 subunit family protein n=1 Tax=Novosphingobium sp. TaxID=1874826 RepID=UPI0025E378B9|nr:complex I NDUFA9 subunit family protein [Novosphingobium sp.]